MENTKLNDVVPLTMATLCEIVNSSPVARRLFYLLLSHAEGNDFTVTMTRDEMVQALNYNSPTISLGLAQLVNKGLVKITGGDTYMFPLDNGVIKICVKS